MALSRLVNRNIKAGRGRTSMRLEPELWEALEEICARERFTMREIMRQIELTELESSRTSAVRVYIVDYYRAASTLAARPRPMLHGEMSMAGA